MSDLERRAEELIRVFRDSRYDLSGYGRVQDAAQVIEQLLSENRRLEQDLSDATTQDFSTLLVAKRAAELLAGERLVASALLTKRAEAAEARVRELDIAYEAAASTLKDKIDRVSAEREAYRTFIEEIAAQQNTMAEMLESGTTIRLAGEPTQLALRARRILAENDR